ncbi:hypothetical protein M1E08_15530 [Erwinia sp. PK3-005]|uniref:FixH family protein n=1 Tax=Mixta hanseatica TaxID=2872648 RepID=A0ABY4RED4_9GAMM|nr:hypothetical protein [Mixta hanseatica]UQY45166.1 hypothetical protein K6958_05670 [Mixta hanseatica]
MENFQQDENKERHYPVRENMRWQRIEWRIQRLGYLLLLAIVISGACGLFSKGFLSDRDIISSNGQLRVEYERFARQQSDMAMTIRLAPLRDSLYRITISGSGIDNFQLQSVQPQPLRAESHDRSLTLWYQTQSLNHGASIWLGGQPQSPGKYTFVVNDSAGEQVQFTQWVYP